MGVGLEEDARVGLLSDLARGGAVWLSDACSVWCGGDRNRCNRLVGALVSEGLVLVRKPERGDGRRRYLVLTERGARVLAETTAQVDAKAGSRIATRRGEDLADRMTLYAEVIQTGVACEEILVGTELHRKLKFRGPQSKTVGVVSKGRTAVFTRLPLPWKKWQALFQGTSPVSLWVILTGNNRAWSQQLDVWTQRPLARPTWIPKPSWSLSRILNLFKNQHSVVEEVLHATADWGLDLTFPETRGPRHASVWAEQHTWCCLGGDFYRLEDFRPVPVHWLSLLAILAPDEAQRVLQCAGIVAVIETPADAIWLSKRMRRGAPCVFLALESKPGQRLLRHAPEGLKPVV